MNLFSGTTLLLSFSMLLEWDRYRFWPRKRFCCRRPKGSFLSPGTDLVEEVNEPTALQTVTLLQRIVTSALSHNDLTPVIEYSHDPDSREHYARFPLREVKAPN